MAERRETNDLRCIYDEIIYQVSILLSELPSRSGNSNLGCLENGPLRAELGWWCWWKTQNRVSRTPTYCMYRVIPITKQNGYSPILIT